MDMEKMMPIENKLQLVVQYVLGRISKRRDTYEEERKMKMSNGKAGLLGWQRILIIDVY
jgi:hypothetical protein